MCTADILTHIAVLRINYNISKIVFQDRFLCSKGSHFRSAHQSVFLKSPTGKIMQARAEQRIRQMNKSKKSASELFEAHSDSAMIFDLHEKAFNKMPFFVVIEIGVSSCHLCAPLDYLCRNHIIHDTSDFCKMLFGFFQTIMFRNTL